MALIKIFKKKKKEKEIEKIEKVEMKKPTQAISSKIERKPRLNKTWQILKNPQVTEKAAELTKKNQYVFRVFPKTNKTEIKKAVENLYNVDVLSVKIVKIPRKKRRIGRILGWRKGYKKAIIKIKEGQKIEILPR